MMHRMGLLISRTATTVWAGAAVMVVLIAIREVTSPQFDSVVKAELALLRFPVYYTTAAICLTAAIGGACLTLIAERTCRRRLGVYLGLLLAAAILMIVDFVYIYGPLREMTAVVDQARPESFRRYHEWSRVINAVDVGFCWLGALLINWPVAHTAAEPPVSST